MLETQEATSIKEIAEKEGVERTYVGDVMKLKYLCPEITSMIMKGTQPRTLRTCSQSFREGVESSKKEARRAVDDPRVSK
jgi:hypothetical protein